MTVNSGVILGSKRPATNYSNCPLKKRPIKYDLEMESDSAIDSASDTENNHKNDSQLNSNFDLEPQNLSTKPEDLRLTNQTSQSDPRSSGIDSLLSVVKWETSQIQPRSVMQHLPVSPSLKIYPAAEPKPLEPRHLNSTSSTASSWSTICQGSQFVPIPTPFQQNSVHQHPEFHQFQNINNTYHRSQFAPAPHHFADIQPSVASLLHLQQNSRLSLNHRSRSLSSESCSGSDRSSPIPESFSSLSPCSSTTTIESSTVIPQAATPGIRGIRYQCPDCSKSYSTFSGLTKHLQFHCSSQIEKSFSCKYCDKVYTSLGALKMHIRTHTLPCKCTICGKAFSRPWLLQGHIRTHTGEKPFSCDYCHRAFADRSNLRAHLQTHTEVKKYSCHLCCKTFSRTSLLNKHQESGCKI